MPNAMQLDMFTKLSALADRPTHHHGSRNGYIAIAIEPESRPNTNAVTIHKNHDVSFFTQDSDLLKKLADSGIRSVDVANGRPCNQYKRRFENVTAQQLMQHQDDFQKLVRDSIQIVLDRQPVKR